MNPPSQGCGAASTDKHELVGRGTAVSDHGYNSDF